jgi:hypothetical protein
MSDKMDYDLAVRGRLEYRALLFKDFFQFICVDQVAVMGQRERPKGKISDNGLNIKGYCCPQLNICYVLWRDGPGVF